LWAVLAQCAQEKTTQRPALWEEGIKVFAQRRLKVLVYGCDEATTKHRA
jgi:hypothetical protein